MVFDSWQVLENFGIDPLTSADRISSSAEPEIEAIIRRCVPVYAKNTPQQYAAFDRDFFLQPILIELDFVELDPLLYDLHSLIMVGRSPDAKVVSMPTSDDGFRVMPILDFYICVNRPLFARLPNGQSDQSWRDNLALRRRKIGHEILYGEQYARYYDWENNTLTRLLIEPTEAQENELLCPTHVVSAQLVTVQQTIPADFSSFEAFMHHENVKAREMYYEGLGSLYCVPQSVSESMTAQFFRTRS